MGENGEGGNQGSGFRIRNPFRRTEEQISPDSPLGKFKQAQERAAEDEQARRDISETYREETRERGSDNSLTSTSRTAGADSGERKPIMKRGWTDEQTSRKEGKKAWQKRMDDDLGK